MNLQDLFTVANLAAAINKLPAIPGKVAALGLFEEKGITTTSVVIDEVQGRLSLVPNTARDADPRPNAGGKRRVFETLHLPLSRSLLPDQIQNVSAFGGGGDATPAQAQIINDHLTEMKNTLEAAREWQRIGALRGKLLDADGSVLEDLYTAFDVTQKTDTIEPLAKPHFFDNFFCGAGKKGVRTLAIEGMIEVSKRQQRPPDEYCHTPTH